jgi:hypothetical protein
MLRRTRTLHLLSKRIIKFAAALGFVLSAAFVSPPTKASTINVNSLGDALATDGACTIREAIINANNDAATWPDCAAGSGPDDINLPAGTITLVNTAPVAVNDVYNINQDTLLNPAAPGVLGNDTDIDGDSLTANIVSGPTHAATFALNANGSFSYMPVAHFTGVDSFTYKANDGTVDSEVATVTINIADTEPPVITASVSRDTLWPPNHSLINVGFMLNVTDNSAGPITTDINVFSNEDDIWIGSGNASPDAANFASGTLLLRSERSGNGSGRIYLILIASNDPSNNSSRKCLSVVVPKSQSASNISFVNAAAAVARAFCEILGTPPVGYFVVGDGPVVHPHSSAETKVRGRVSVTGGTDDSTDSLPEQSPLDNRVTVPNTIVSVSGERTSTKKSGERTSTKEYDEFLRVIDHLKREALQKDDIAALRSQAKQLLKLGAAIINLGVPTGTNEDKAEAFKNQLANFRKALDKYGADAESGVDSDLKTSYSAVHDSFERLADMLPPK